VRQRATHATMQMLAGELVDLDLTPSEPSVLDRLERRGHITRGVKAGDRRSVVIELTPSGAAAAETIEASLRELEERAFASLSPRTIAAFHTALAALTAVE
jgi:DNA-binding MarR family transcriptional regulator